MARVQLLLELTDGASCTTVHRVRRCILSGHGQTPVGHHPACSGLIPEQSRSYLCLSLSLSLSFSLSLSLSLSLSHTHTHTHTRTHTRAHTQWTAAIEAGNNASLDDLAPKSITFDSIHGEAARANSGFTLVENDGSPSSPSEYFDQLLYQLQVTNK